MSTLREALRELPAAVFADVLESEEAYLVVVDLPGVTAETVELRVERGILHVEAGREKSPSPEFELVSEGREDDLGFELPLPVDASGRDASASVDRGVLEVRLPRRSSSATVIPVDEA